ALLQSRLPRLGSARLLRAGSEASGRSLSPGRRRIEGVQTSWPFLARWPAPAAQDRRSETGSRLAALRGTGDARLPPRRRPQSVLAALQLGERARKATQGSSQLAY